MAETQHGVWGIDLGQCALKALRLEDVDGEITATAFDYVEHPKILSQPDADPDELTREALTKFLERNTIRGDTVCISVPGQSGLARFVKLPPVEEKKIADIVRFEAKQQIPFNLEEVVWDYQKIGSGTVTDGFAMETEIGLFAMKRDMIGRYLQHFKDVGVDVQVVQMAPLALSNFVAYDLLGKGRRVEGESAKKTNCVVALDIGADSSNLVITDGDRVIWQRPIPLGGNHFTRALTKELKLTFAKAEHLKRNATKSPDLKKILSSLKPVLNDFVGEVQRSLGYFTNTHRNAQIEYMIGLGNAFRLPGLQKYLGEKLQLDVKKVTKMQRLTGETVVTAPTFNENILSYGVAYGLALQGLGQTRILTNLLPGEIRTERLVKAKKPWAAAAAAVLLLGVSAMSLKAYWGDTRPWGNDPKQNPNDTNPVTIATKDAEGVNGRVQAAKNAFEAAKAEGKKQEQAVRSIVAGQDELTNWIAIDKFISDAIPKPDGTNLPPNAVKDYWLYKARDRADAHPNLSLAMTGQQAWEEYKNQLSAGKPGGSTDDPLGRGIDDRVQFNIELVNSRYCGDLGAFWEKVSKDLGKEYLKEYVRPLEQIKTPPTGKGWVFEVHGYTFNYKKNFFVRDTLMENIVRLSAAPAQPANGATTPGQPVPQPEAADKTAKADSDPIRGRISHVILYKVKDMKTNDASSFSLIKNSVLPDLTSSDSFAAGPGGPGAPGGGDRDTGGKSPLPGAPGAPGGPGGGGPGEGGGGAPTVNLRDTWTPLGSIGGGGATYGGMEPGAGPGVTMRRPGGPGDSRPGGPGRKFGDLPDRRGGPGDLPVGPGGPGDTTAPPGAKTVLHERTEFIVLFIWKEPTPSDDLRGITEETTDTPKQ
jgi:type IV pilus assembly protein PilM